MIIKKPNTCGTVHCKDPISITKLRQKCITKSTHPGEGGEMALRERCGGREEKSIQKTVNAQVRDVLQNKQRTWLFKKLTKMFKNPESSPAPFPPSPKWYFYPHTRGVS